MIRPLIAATVPAALIVGAAALFLWAMPVKAGECWNWRASWYGSESGNRTANGEHFDGSSYTAAHKTLPFGAKLKVTYQGKNVVVRVNDRGPFTKGRSLDLAKAAANKIGLAHAGVDLVRVCRVG